MNARKRTAMSVEHKAALATGRLSGIAVRRYLEALETLKPRRGRRSSVEAVSKQLADIDSVLASADPLHRLHLVQKRRDLQARLHRTEDDSPDMAALEAAFVAVAADYGDRKGLSYGTWREARVPADTLRKAGIGRSRS